MRGLVNQYILYLLVPLFSSPVIAFLYSKSYGVGKLRLGFRFIGGRLENLKLMDDVIVAETNSGYVGVSYIDLGEEFFNFREKTPDYFFTRANVLGRLLSSISSEAELRVARISLDTSTIAERLLKELSSLRAVIESVGEDETLAERERILKKIYTRIREGENISGLRAYMVLRLKGRELDSLCRKLREEAEEVSRGFSIILGIRPKILRGKELRKVMEARLFLAPPMEPIMGGEIEASANIPVPPYENGTLDSRGVFLGYRRKTKIPFFYDIRRYGTRHLLVVGPTGKGKTTLLATIANRLYSRNQADMILVDPKGDLARLVSKGFERMRFCTSTPLSRIKKPFYKSIGGMMASPGNQEMFGMLSDRPSSMGELEDLLGVRLFFVRKECPGRIVDPCRLLEHKRSVVVMDNLTDTGRFMATAMILYCMLENMYEMPTSESLRKLVIIDESWRSGEASLYYTRRLVKESRGFGIGLMFSTQSLTDIPLDVLHNFGTSMVFGSPEAGYIEGVSRLTGFDKKQLIKSIPVLGIGEVMVKLPDTSIPVFVDIDAEVASSSGHKLAFTINR